MAELINKNDICFRCSYGGDCMADIEDCKICVHYVCDYEDIQNVDVITEQKIRNKAIEEFAEAIKTSQDAHTWCCNDLTLEFCVGDDCKECLEKFKARIDEIAESMKGEKE